MKRVVKCIGCWKVVGLYKSYKVHMQERTKSTLTGKMKEIDYEGRICKECSIKAGYKK